MKISIIVPAFNEERLLADSLAAIHSAARTFAGRGWTYELIVCDNNSTDRTAEIARGAGAQVVFEPVNQIGRARNTGAEAATGDWLLFIDADSRPSDELLADMAGHIETGRVLGGGATVRVDDERWMSRFFVTIWNLIGRVGRQMAGSFLFVEVTAFRRLEGFSNEFFAAEELDFCKRLKKLASETKQSIVILHRHPLYTSGRKLDLYSPWEIIRMLLRVLATGGQALRSRATTQFWYDGRR